MVGDRSNKKFFCSWTCECNQTKMLQRRVCTSRKSIPEKVWACRIDGGSDHADAELDTGDAVARFVLGCACLFVCCHLISHERVGIGVRYSPVSDRTADIQKPTLRARNRRTAAARPEIAGSNFSSTTEGSNDDPCTCLSVGEGLMVI